MIAHFRSLCLVLPCFILANTFVVADELDGVCQFLQENAVNRTLGRETKGTIAGGAVAYEFRREMTICNLVRSDSRLCFDIIYTIKQRNWDLKDGEKFGEPRVEDRMIVERHEFGVRKSTGEVTGFSRIITSTRADWAGSTATLRMRLDNGNLLVERATALYTDHFGPGDKFYPGATVEKQTWFIRDGKLVVESRTAAYKVDTASREKKFLESDPPKEDIETVKLPIK